MTREGVDRLIDRWATDESFRRALSKDPELAIEQAGIDLSEEELAAIKALDLGHVSCTELESRISKKC